MTGNDTPPTFGGAAGGPPWPLELLADLHAGVFDAADAAELHARVAADPQARATLAALDATRTALAELPPLRMPDDVASRIDAALREEAAGRATTAFTAPATTAAPAAHAGPAAQTVPAAHAAPSAAGAPVVDLAEARERRRRRGLLAGAGLLTAAAAVVGAIVVSGLTGGQTAGTPQAGPTNASDQALPPLALSQGDLGAALDQAMSVNDYGPLGAGRLDACLAANRLDPKAATPLGAREVTLDGEPGVLLILPTGTAARLRLLVVSPDCGPGNPAVLAEATVGR